MQYVYLVSSVMLSASGGLLGGFFNRKNEGKKGTSALYTALLSFVVFLFWLVLFLCEGCKFDFGVILYSFGFALCYFVNNITFMQALKCGSLLLTSLISRLSLVGVSVWGFFFWGAEFKWYIGVGFVLIAASVFLCLYAKNAANEANESVKQKTSFKWLIYTVLNFASGAGCSIIQKNQQLAYDKSYGNFFMMVATGISFIVCLIMYLKNDRTDAEIIIKKSWHFPVLAGIFNGMLNLFVMFLATSDLSSSLIYPTIGVGSLMITTAFSALAFKEKMKWWQWIGVGLGAIAVCILSI